MRKAFIIVANIMFFIFLIPIVFTNQKIIKTSTEFE